ncbi:RNA-binding protein [Patescibacteria group bacterium]|nr:RNA-binding protein [Patescibacteria group bacterium]
MEENRLYVGGLPYNYSDEQLREMFSQAGNVVNVNIISDKFSGQSKGFGFVEMSNAQEAQKAIEMFNGKEIDNRKITVNIARPREERGSDKGPGGRSGRRSR